MVLEPIYSLPAWRCCHLTMMQTMLPLLLPLLCSEAPPAETGRLLLDLNIVESLSLSLFMLSQRCCCHCFESNPLTNTAHTSTCGISSWCWLWCWLQCSFFCAQKCHILVMVQLLLPLILSLLCLGSPPRLLAHCCCCFNCLVLIVILGSLLPYAPCLYFESR